MRTDTPESRTGPGRRPTPGPAGLAFFIEPAGGHTWKSLHDDWNQLHHSQPGWRYTSASNFTRDAKTALIRLLFPGWDSSPTHRSTSQPM